MSNMNKEELEKELKKIKEENQILTKMLETELGYVDAHRIIDRAKMEYTIMKTNLALEKR